MTLYLLNDCSGNLFNLWTDADLSDLTLNQIVQTVEYPGTCWRIIDIEEFGEDEETPIFETVTHVGPVFSDCTDCLNNIISGCTDSRACNFNPCATIDDGSCTFNNVTIRVLCNDGLQS